MTPEEELKFMEDGIEMVQTLYYESGTLPSGSVAVLEDGRRLVTEDAWIRVIGVYHDMEIKKANKVRNRRSSK